MSATLTASRTGKTAASDGDDAHDRPRTPGVVWVVIAAGVFAILGSTIAASFHAPPALWRILAVGVVFAVGDAALLHIRFGHDQNSFTLSETALVVGFALLPVPWVVVIAPFAVGVTHFLARRSPLKVAFNALSFGVGALLAGATYTAIAGGSASAVTAALGMAVGALVFFAWNTSTMAAAVASSQKLPFIHVYGKGLLLCLLVWACNTAVGLLVVNLMLSGSAFVFLVPALLGLLYFMYWSYLRAMHERDLWQLLQATSRQLLRVEPADVARVVMDSTPALFSAEFVELLLVPNEDAPEATIFRWQGPDGEQEVLDSRLHYSNPFWGRMLAEREPFQMTAEEAPALQRAELESLGLAKCIVAPLLVHDRCLGTLRVGFRGDVRFGAREMQVLTTFANHVSAAMHNTRLFDAMRVQALHDPLTGLANRTLLLDRLRHALERAEHSSDTVAVLFFDLDRFKVVNDSMGHDAGDQLLISVANRLADQLRPGDTAARFGGDEFVILCENIRTGYEALSIAERLLDGLGAPIVLRGQHLFISASVGVALAQSPMDDAAGLLRDADAAMYQAKAKGPARCELFDTHMRERAVSRLELESDLRRGLERGELRLDYQPNVRLSDDAIVGLEALIRWEHPERGAIAPADFIPLAEETGLIVPVGAWVIQQACIQLARWSQGQGIGVEPLYISINLSPVQLMHPGLVSHVASVLRSTRVEPSRVCFEVTETALVDDVQGAREILDRLRSLGVRIALDDFGTGYSSLSYLQTLPVDVLKLDRSFVARLTPEAKGRAVVAGMIELAHALDLTVVAEGVENEEQLVGLRALNCDVVQGYHFFVPQTPAALERTLRPVVLPPEEVPSRPLLEAIPPLRAVSTS